jgi:3-methyl-2-oxobutanoate hydroxymethyltransferase
LSGRWIELVRTTIHDLGQMKRKRERIVMLTAYDHPSARVADRAGVSVLLVGDSLGMVVLGRDDTLAVTLDDMVRHAAAVVRGSERALVVADLPFLTYPTETDAIRSAGRLVREAGVQAVKLEGGGPVIPIAARLVELGIPVMAHLGFTPQSVNQIGVRVQGKRAQAALRLLEDAVALEAAGAFSLVLELVPAPLAKAVTERLSIPVIGIGAGAQCDGQVQVWHDILGLYEGKPPRHAKQFADAGGEIDRGLRAYVAAVQGGQFPSPAQSTSMNDDELNEALRLYGGH